MGSVFDCLSDSKQLTIIMNKLVSIIFMFTIAAMTVSGQPYGIDVNNDGRIDRAEFHWANPDLDLYEEFGKLDLNKDGFIDQSEQQTNLEDESRNLLCFAKCRLRFLLRPRLYRNCIRRCR